MTKEQAIDILILEAIVVLEQKRKERKTFYFDEVELAKAIITVAKEHSMSKNAKEEIEKIANAKKINNILFEIEEEEK